MDESFHSSKPVGRRQASSQPCFRRHQAMRALQAAASLCPLQLFFFGLSNGLYQSCCDDVSAGSRRWMRCGICTDWRGGLGGRGAGDWGGAVSTLRSAPGGEVDQLTPGGQAASAWACGAARSNALKAMQATSMRRICGNASSGVSKRRALAICGIRQQSARVGVSPWQKAPVSKLLASSVSSAVKPKVTQCRYHLTCWLRQSAAPTPGTTAHANYSGDESRRR